MGYARAANARVQAASAAAAAVSPSSASAGTWERPVAEEFRLALAKERTQRSGNSGRGWQPVALAGGSLNNKLDAPKELAVRAGSAEQVCARSGARVRPSERESENQSQREETSGAGRASSHLQPKPKSKPNLAGCYATTRRRSRSQAQAQAEARASSLLLLCVPSLSGRALGCSSEPPESALTWLARRPRARRSRASTTGERRSTTASASSQRDRGRSRAEQP